MTRTFERPGGYYYAFWYESPGPSLDEAEASLLSRAPARRPAAPPKVEQPVEPPIELAGAPTVYPWAYSPEAAADPHRDTWVKHCDGKPLSTDEYDFVLSQPIPEYAKPCYPPK